MDFLDAAFRLTAFGWKVFPILPGQKIPAVPKAEGGRGCLDATDDEEQIGAWARRYPRANIGINCGEPSRILVIDLDPRNGSDESIARFKAKKQLFPATVTARTANGGAHLYYAFEPSLKNSKSVLAPGIDVKSTNGYVVAPPSVLDGGKRYSWVNSPLGGDLPRLPRWAFELLKPKPQPIAKFDSKTAPKDVGPLVEFVGRAKEGERNNALFWAACRAAESGQLGGAGEAALVAAACAAGLDKPDIEKTIESARKRGKLA